MKNIYSLDKKEFKNAEKQFLKTYAGKTYNTMMWLISLILMLSALAALFVLITEENSYAIIDIIFFLLFPISFILMANLLYHYLEKLNEYIKEQ